MKTNIAIWICEDDNKEWKKQKEILKEYFPKCKIKHFENAGYASNATGSPDFILVDVGGAMSLGCDVVSLTRYNVEGLSELHPGAIFIVFSVIGELAKEAYEDLKPDIKAVSIWLDGCDFYSCIGEAIRSWL